MSRASESSRASSRALVSAQMSAGAARRRRRRPARRPSSGQTWPRRPPRPHRPRLREQRQRGRAERGPPGRPGPAQRGPRTRSPSRMAGVSGGRGAARKRSWSEALSPLVPRSCATMSCPHSSPGRHPQVRRSERGHVRHAAGRARPWPSASRRCPPGRRDRSTQTLRMPRASRRHVVVVEALGHVDDPLRRQAEAFEEELEMARGAGL